MTPVTPAVVLGITSYANHWYNTGNAADVKPLLFAGITGLLLEALAAIPGMNNTAVLLGWMAVIGMLISPAQNPSPVQNLLKITGGK